MLTADCVYFRTKLDEMRVPAFGYSAAMKLDSMRTLSATEHAGCRLLFGHDVDQFGALPAEGIT